MQHSSSCPTTIVVGINLCKLECESLPNPTQYCSVLGALQYLTQTRPDISFVVNKLNQFIHNPSSIHWQAFKRLFRYLLYSFKLVQCYNYKDFSDVDWACSNTDRKSLGGYCVFFENVLVSWSSKKQQAVSRSSIKYDYRALGSSLLLI